jgi:diguanylate cyclase (GGDEF)-like protein/PAS domain S-box-containing protein
LAPWRHEFRVRLPELGERWMLGDSRPERLDDGSVQWHGYVTDITELKHGAQVLADSEKRYRALFDTNPSPIWVYDLETLRILAVNEAAILHYGYTRDEFLAMTVKDLRPPEEVPALLERVAASKEGRIDHASHWRHRTRSGADIVVESTSQVVVFDGRRAKIVVITDVTERLRAEEQIRLAEKVFDNSRQAIMITDPKPVILRVNRAFERITGYSQEEVVGRSPGILSSGRQGRQFYADLWRSLDQGGVWEGELWNRRKSGEVYPEYLAISAVRDRDGNAINYVGIFQDIGERKSAEERIQFLAHHDALTGLPNRSLLRDRAEMALYHAKRQGHSMAILFIDLDRFKTINDSLGHEIGDFLLKQASERILATVRGGDTVCRLGGDEFVVLLPDIKEAEDAKHVADKLIAAVNRPYTIDGHELLITCSVGIAMFPDHGGDIDTLQRNADAAMYAAKNSGRNASLFYSPEMNAEALEYLTMEYGLRRAVERDELFLEYQPQVDLADGRITGMEALVRWHHPERGVLMPGVFIGIAEESGLIASIGTWVLRRACEDMRRLAQLGLGNLPVAVNVSAIQFGKPDFVQQVRSAIVDAGVSAAMLELEVTEGVIMRGSHPEIETLRQLDELGLQLSIDDFGTGYSSLNYLRRFPVDKLKIDQSFVRDLSGNAGGMTIVEAIIALGHALGLKVIAEGVETTEQADLLRGRKCDQAQGYYFGRPMPMDELVSLILRQRSGAALS